LLLILIAAGWNKVSARVVVTGNIQHTKAKTMSVSYNSSIISYHEQEKDFAIDAKGNFKIELDIKHKIILRCHRYAANNLLCAGKR